jgi:hypothetical protein
VTASYAKWSARTPSGGYGSGGPSDSPVASSTGDSTPDTRSHAGVVSTSAIAPWRQALLSGTGVTRDTTTDYDLDGLVTEVDGPDTETYGYTPSGDQLEQTSVSMGTGTPLRSLPQKNRSGHPPARAGAIRLRSRTTSFGTEQTSAPPLPRTTPAKPRSSSSAPFSRDCPRRSALAASSVSTTQGLIRSARTMPTEPRRPSSSQVAPPTGIGSPARRPGNRVERDDVYVSCMWLSGPVRAASDSGGRWGLIRDLPVMWVRIRRYR